MTIFPHFVYFLIILQPGVRSQRHIKFMMHEFESWDKIYADKQSFEIIYDYCN